MGKGRSSYDTKSLSRSKLDLFCQCPLCLYMDVRLRVKRVGSPAYTLNIAVDALLKKEFDLHRKAQTPHPIFATVGLDAVPLADERIATWCSNFKGLRYLDPVTGWTLFGAPDDFWKNSDGTVSLADYKATSKAAEITAESLYPGYLKQQDIYQAIGALIGLRINRRSWFYYVNGDKTPEAFGGSLTFKTTLIPYDGDPEWVLPKFREAVRVIESPEPPQRAMDCEWCDYREAALATVLPALKAAA